MRYGRFGGSFPGSVSEDGGTNLVYTFTRSGVTSGALTVNFSIDVRCPTTPPSPLIRTNRSVDFRPACWHRDLWRWQCHRYCAVDSGPDSLVEPDETVVFTVTSGAGYMSAHRVRRPELLQTMTRKWSVAVAPSSVAEDGATNPSTPYANGSTATPLTVTSASTWGGNNATFATDYTQSGAGLPTLRRPAQ